MASTLAEYVYQNVRGRILDGAATPQGLTLRVLAREFGVSVMPVRQAVARLIAEGLLERGNGRLVVRRRGTKAAKAARTRRPLAAPTKDCFEAVFRDLVPLSFRGGTYLREEAFARAHGTSRARIRQVLARLVGIGLLEHHPRHGVYLRPYSKRGLLDFLEAREALETKALALAWPRLEKRRLQGCLVRNVMPAGREPPQTDNSFHRYIVERADNRYISAFFERFGRYYDLLFEWEGLDRESEVIACRQHRRILRAMIAGDYSTAATELSRHILDNHRLLEAVDGGKE